MNESSEQPRQPREEDSETSRPGEGRGGKSKPEVPPASETWVEGQPESDADYPK